MSILIPTKKNNLKVSFRTTRFLLAVFVFILFLPHHLFLQEFNFTLDKRISDDISVLTVIPSDLFLETSLVASGTEDSDIPVFLKQLKDATETLRLELHTNSIIDKNLIAEYTLQFLYKNIFTRYSFNQTKVDVALNSGIYNCVSATVIFMYCMKVLGIEVIAVETPNHTFCTVTIDNQKIDVETTNPYGFNPGVKQKLSSDPNQKNYMVVPAKNYYGRKSIDDRRILSIIYNNRIASLQRQKNHHQTIPLSLDAMKLQNNSEESVKTFQTCVANTASNFIQKNKNEDAITLVLNATSLYGNCALFSDCIETAVNNKISLLQRNKHYDEAFQFLETYKNHLKEKTYSSYFSMLVKNNLNNMIMSDTFTNSYKAIKDNETVLSASDFKKFLSLSYSYEAVRIEKSSGFIHAWQFLEDALLELPNDSTLLKQINVYKYNYTAFVHNEAAHLMNQGAMDEAKKVILEGLKSVPDSSILLTDLRRIEKSN